MSASATIEHHSSAPDKIEPAKPLWKRVARSTERVLAIFGVVLIIWNVGFHVTKMTSGSMSPTLKGNGKPGSDWVLTERFTHWFRAPHRWELIAFYNAEGLQVMKRVVALPGEKLVVKRDGTFIVNGEIIERPESLKDIKYYPIGRLASENCVDVGDGYFVLGDDSRDSQDSRFDPCVSQDAINGRPWLILWPWSRCAFVNP